MGFDLNGINPRSKEKCPDFDVNDDKSLKKYWKWQEETPGAYFRNNVWWWRPLWEYVCMECRDFLSEEDMRAGGYNDGYIIGDKKATKIGIRLKQRLETGAVQRFKDGYEKERDSQPDEPCDLCHATGIRNDEVIQGKCNKCGGKGKVRPFNTNYPFDVQNVREFADFAIASGGFEIC